MKLAVLTSSRADYSQYVPLLCALRSDPFFMTDIIAFGTHLSAAFGTTVDRIIEDGFTVRHRIDTIVPGDSPADISLSMGKTMTNFSSLWATDRYDLIFAFGDRYEMFAACASSVPFRIPIAHLHGGETTLGAIDNVFRHAISLMASYHFTTTDHYSSRVAEITGQDTCIFNVGALSIDNLCKLDLLSKEAFREKFGIDLEKPTILITFHPETVHFDQNEVYCDELIAALSTLSSYQLVITMPNADTAGKLIREKLDAFCLRASNAIGIESFGTIGYLTCMKYCRMMIGNTSSGFVEASFFPTPVINLGLRQTGRIMTDNIISCPVQKEAILQSVLEVERCPVPVMQTIYGDGNAAGKIINILKSI